MSFYVSSVFICVWAEGSFIVASFDELMINMIDAIISMSQL